MPWHASALTEMFGVLGWHPLRLWREHEVAGQEITAIRSAIPPPTRGVGAQRALNRTQELRVSSGGGQAIGKTVQRSDQGGG
jgi:hypothetical protein